MPRDRVFWPMRGPPGPIGKSDTVTPFPFISSARALVNAARAAEHESYAIVSGETTPTLTALTMWPEPRAAMWGTSAVVVRTAPSRLVSMTQRQSPVLMRCSGPCRKTPAMLRRMST